MISTPRRPGLPRLPRPTASQSIGIGLLLLGGTAALNFGLELNMLTRAISGPSQMGLVAPVMFLASGVACVLLGGRNGGLSPSARWVVLACAALLAVFPALMMVEHLAGVSIGVDFPGAVNASTPLRPFPGRMSPNACLAFGLSAVTFWVLLLPYSTPRRLFTLASVIGIVLIGSAGCIGYVLNLEHLYHIGAANRLLLPVACGLTALSVGLWLLRERWILGPGAGLNHHELRIGQRSLAVLAVVVIAAGVGGFAVIQQAYDEAQADALLLTATTSADALANTLEVSAWLPRAVATRPSVGTALEQLRADPHDAQALGVLWQAGNELLTGNVSGVRFESAAGPEIITVGRLVIEASDISLALAPAFAGSRLVWKNGYLLHWQHPVNVQGREVGRITGEQPLPLFEKLLATMRRASDSSDALVCNRVGANALCIPTRFYLTPFTIPMQDAKGKPNYPINRALLGETGMAVTKDLREVQVIAAYTPIAATGLALVVKMNSETLFAAARDRLNVLIALLLGLVGAGWWFLRSQVRPLVSHLGAEQRHTRLILEHSNDAFVEIGEDGRITDWNAQAQRLFGWPAAQAIGRDLAGLIFPAGQGTADNADFFRRACTEPNANQRFESAALHRDGHTFMAELSVAGFEDARGRVAQAFIRDITDRLAGQRKIERSEKHLRNIANNLPVLIGDVGKDRTLMFANQTFAHWIGLDPDQLTGKPVGSLGAPTYDEHADRFTAALAGQRVEYESVLSALGAVRTLHTVLVPDLRSGGYVAGVYALSSDVTLNKAAERHLYQLARIDALTGLPNRRQFEERLGQAMARSGRSKRPMALIFMDVDHFKAINDTHGHSAGDEVLKEIGVRLERTIRSTDLAARLAGDEFVVILEGLNTVEEASVVAGKLVDSIRRPMGIEGNLLHVTASIGLAYFEGQGSSAEALVAHADRALYRAKDAGRDTFAATML